MKNYLTPITVQTHIDNKLALTESCHDNSKQRIGSICKQICIGKVATLTDVIQGAPSKLNAICCEGRYCCNLNIRVVLIV